MQLSKHAIRTVTAAALCATAVTLWPSEASAQRRGRVVRARPSAVVVARPLYFGYGFYDPFWWGAPGWYPYGWYPPYYAHTEYANIGSARLQVKPNNAEVYVDGHLVGSVDDFDGFLQRLEIPAGEHELTFYLDGYQTVTQRVLFRPRATLDVKYELQPLSPGESAGPRPQAPPRPSGSYPAPAGASDTAAPRPTNRFGAVAIRVQPSDATLIVDGQEWTASEGGGPVLIELSEGAHEIEIRKQGYTTFRRTVRVRSGETFPLNVSLSR